MKYNRLFIWVLAAGFIFTACTDMESLSGDDILPSYQDDDRTNYPPPPPPPKTDIELDIDKPEWVAMREWKATPGLPQVFVWFDNWSGTHKTGNSSMRGLPDSITIASNWGGHPKFALSEDRKKDMEYVQKVKGTKVVVTLFSAKVGEDMPNSLNSPTPDPDYVAVGSNTDEATIRPGIKKYAEAIYDAVIEAGYDGYDWDFEPTASGGGASNPLWWVPEQAGMFVEELSYWFGPGAVDPTRDRGGRKPVEKRLLFLIDGEVHNSRMRKEWLTYYVDYFVQQAYGATTISNNQSRATGIMTQMTDHIDAGRITKAEVVRRMILTENFESFSYTGGGILVQAAFVYNVTAGNYAINHQIGGFGVYRVGFDWSDLDMKWNWMPQGITKLYNVYRDRQGQGLDQYPD